MSQLNQSTLGSLPDSVGTPQYDRTEKNIGIVHLGPGAFHRAHQAVFTEDAMPFGGDWGICGVSMRSRGVKENLATQDNLYTLAIIDNDSRSQVIGALKEVLVLADDREAIVARMTAPTTHIISLTITEKGYCLNTQGGLDVNHPDIQHDLAHLDSPNSAIGLIVQVLRQRFAAGIGEITVMSCDNLADNGDKLATAVCEFATQIDPDLANQIRREVAFPCSMVDSITPATDDALKAQVSEQLGVTDNWPIQREAFTQWVIEDHFTGPRPAWDKVGVTLTSNVNNYEKAKLRLLNGSHSTLAYLGILCGHETVYEGVSDDALAAFVESMLAEEVVPSLNAPAEMQIEAYMQAVLKRYHNPHIRHMLAQIAWDGSQKLPFRLLGTVRDNLEQGVSVRKLCVGVAAWFRFLNYKARVGTELVDPMASVLLDVAKQSDGSAEDVHRFLAISDVFARDLPDNPVFVKALTQAYVQLADLETQGAQLLKDYL